MMRKKYNVFHLQSLFVKNRLKTCKKYYKGPPINYTSLMAKFLKSFSKIAKKSLLSVKKLFHYFSILSLV